MEYSDIYNRLNSSFYDSLSLEEKELVDMFKLKWDNAKFTNLEKKFKCFVNNNMYYELEKYIKDNSLSSNDRLTLFKWFMAPKFKNGLFNGKDYLIPLDIKYNEISNLLFNSEYNIVTYLIDNSNDIEIIDKLRNDPNYMFATNRKAEYLLKGYSHNGKIIRNMDYYNIIFDDMCLSDKFLYHVFDYLENDCFILNKENLISIAQNLYMHGVDGLKGFDSYNKSKKLLDIINSKVNDKKLILINEENINISMNELLDKFIMIDESSEGITKLNEIIDLKRETIEKKKAYKLTNY